MEKLSSILETYMREEPTRETPPRGNWEQQIESFAHNKSKRKEVIKAFTEISEHPQAEDFSSDVGSAFDESDLDEELRAAYEAVGEGGMIYSSFEHSFWIRHKGKLIRVM